MKSKSINADAKKIVNGLSVLKPLADEVYNELQKIKDEEEKRFREERYALRLKLNGRNTH
tara:strand:+ start:63 stop:242 length:180 start_codon:yes stop_codon:yes gene_type:complete